MGIATNNTAPKSHPFLDLRTSLCHPCRLGTHTQTIPRSLCIPLYHLCRHGTQTQTILMYIPLSPMAMILISSQMTRTPQYSKLWGMSEQMHQADVQSIACTAGYTHFCAAARRPDSFATGEDAGVSSSSKACCKQKKWKKRNKENVRMRHWSWRTDGREEKGRGKNKGRV